MVRMTPSRMRNAMIVASAAVMLVLTGCVPAPGPSPTASPSATAAPTPPCEGPDGVGGPVPAGLGPGDLVAAVDLTAENASSPGFPTEARVWRMLYVTTGVDETDLQLVCGTVAAPEDGPQLFGSRGRILNWSHGTVGIAQECLPSSDPATGIWGPMPGGINTIAWGTDLSKREGDPAGGLLQYALDEGWVVASADYQPDVTYVVGKMEASAILDAARAATQLVNQEYPELAPGDYDAVIWGHSQGGHAALWAGQLAESYLAGTRPSQPTAGLTLVGVAALAPASNFITQQGQPSVAPGDGLADWEMHKNIGLDLPDPALQMQIGPALFSYIFGAWEGLSEGREPAEDAAFPAYPPTVGPVDLSDIATPTGEGTVDTIKALCLRRSSAAPVQEAAEKYADAAEYQMVVPQIWNLPADYTPGEYFRGGLDATCLTTAEPGLIAWCEWMRWNLPGPLGLNPYPKAPIVGDEPVPLFIAQGIDDDIIHCQPVAGESGEEVPNAANCMSRALYESLETGIYCPDGDPAGSLDLVGVRSVGIGGVDSPASHFSVPGEISAKSILDEELVFAGSPLQKFFTAAFEGNTEPGCRVTMVG